MPLLNKIHTNDRMYPKVNLCSDFHNRYAMNDTFNAIDNMAGPEYKIWSCTIVVNFKYKYKS